MVVKVPRTSAYYDIYNIHIYLSAFIIFSSSGMKNVLYLIVSRICVDVIRAI